MAASGIFLSYARKDDEPFVVALSDALCEAGFAVWFDRVSMPNRGLSFYQEIRDAIDFHDRLIAVIGPAAATSAYVRSEWQYALVAGKPVTPLLRAGDYDLLPAELRNLDCPDFRGQWDHTKFDKLVTDLRGAPSVLGELFDVPSPPPHFQPRINELEAISDHVLPDLKAPVVVALNDRATVIHGMGGAGKSVIAAAFARNWESRRAFPDGILWLDLRHTASRTAPLAAIGARLGDDPAAYSDSSGITRLAECLRDKSCLIVVDNAEYLEQVRPVREALGHKARLLITTRQSSLASGLGGREVGLGNLTVPMALALLGDWSGRDVAELPREAEILVQRCGALAFALALCGAALRHGASWQALLDGLERADLDFVQAKFADYEQFDTVAKCLQYGVDLLAEQDADAAARYLELVVFATRQRIPEHVLARFWNRRGALPDYRAQAILVELQARSLAQIESTGANRYVVLHDLHRLYLRARTPGATGLHRALVRAYEASCPNGWPSGPNDGYFFQHLSEHLAAANQSDRLTALLTASPDWMRASMQALGQVQQFCQDVAIALAHTTRPEHAIALVTSRCVASRQVNQYDEKCLRAMVRLGRQEEAKHAARLALGGGSGWYLTLAVYDETAKCGAEDRELRDICLDLARRHPRPEIRAGLKMNVAATVADNDPQRSAALFRDAREILKGVEVPQQRQASLLELAVCLARAGRWDEIDALLPGLGDHEGSLLARWVEECCKRGRREQALAVVAEAKSGYARCCALSALLTSERSLYGDEKTLAASLVVAAGSGESGLERVQALAAAFPALARLDGRMAVGILKKAAGMARKLEPFPVGDYESALSALIEGLCKTERPDYIEVAVQLAQDLTSALDYDAPISNYPRRLQVANVLENIAGALVRSGDLGGALALIDKDPSEFHGTTIASTVAYCASLAGHPRSAELLDSAAELHTAFKHREARTDLLCALADEARARKDKRVDQELLQKAYASSHAHPLSLARLVRSLGSREPRRAREIALSIDHEDERGRSIAALIWSLVQARRFADARTLIRSLRKWLPNQVVRAQVLTVLGEELAVAGWTKEAAQVIRLTDMPRDEDRMLLLASGAALRRKDYATAVECAMRIHWIWSRVKMLNAIAARLNDFNKAEALEVFLLVRQSVIESKDIGTDQQRNAALRDLACRIAHVGLHDESLVVASQIGEKGAAIATQAEILSNAAEKRPPSDAMLGALLSQTRALPAGNEHAAAACAVACLFAAVRRIDEAEQIAGEIDTQELKHGCLENIARWCVRHREFVVACRLIPETPLEVWFGDLVAWTYHLEKAGASKWPEPIETELRRAAWSAGFWGDVADILSNRGGVSKPHHRHFK